ncbi:low specificity L-threonine aldolase [Maribius pontilimi]|uniref:Low specificity L-threonine aldolase n=1 Tax=Palleronia pontilimi TaxID=1964209 RepID=A0A934M9I1_9RHOB|nr:beta-eliminating lyase-related protein [Palleronia pontilimi]MBJ3762572.1 low specificity L-threonine aldolase [Palleronia pontilimi]
MHFASDNTGPAHPQVMQALMDANDGYAMPYGVEEQMDRVRDRLRALFEAPDAAVYLVATGSACNALILATLGQPWQAIYCSEVAHIEEDECGAPEFFTGGAKLALVDAPDAMMVPGALRDRIARTDQGVVHGVQRGPVSLTTVTERGTVYGLDQIQALCGVAKDYGLPVHLDGARFANALVVGNHSPADMTWRAGVDAVSFGGTKNGLLGVEAAIFFNPAHAWEFELRRKRSGHLFSKHRYLSAQMLAYLQDDLWLDMARAANAACARLRDGLAKIDHVRLDHPSHANIVYCSFPRAAHVALKDAGAQFYSMDTLDGDGAQMVRARLVCDWSASDTDTDRFLDILAG